MHSSYAPFLLLISILLLTAAVRPHPQVPLPSSGEPPAAFPLENSRITAREDTEDVGFGTPRSLKSFSLDGGLSGVEQFLSSTSGSTDNGDSVEMRINYPGILPLDESSNRSGEENMISQSNACDQRSNSLKSRRLRNRNPGQKLPSSCLANPIERNSPSEPQIKPGIEQSGTDNRELNEEKNIPVDVPVFENPTKGKDYMGTSTKTEANLEICPPERVYPLCADDQAISAMPEGFTQVTYMLYPAFACTSPRWIPCSYHRRDDKINTENVRKRT